MTKIKRKAESFIKEHKIYDITYQNLKNVTEEMGYIIVEYDRSYNDENVEELIGALKLRPYVEASRGFTYVDMDNRIIFLSKSLNDYEKLIVLSHEIGHICLNHFNSGNIIGNDVIQEKDANEFSHYLLKNSIKMQIYLKFNKNKKRTAVLIIAAATLIVGVVGIGIAQKQKSYFGNYYVTETGCKYHKKNCIFVKNKANIHRLTKEEFSDGRYTPCNICLPE